MHGQMNRMRRLQKGKWKNYPQYGLAIPGLLDYRMREVRYGLKILKSGNWTKAYPKALSEFTEFKLVI